MRSVPSWPEVQKKVFWSSSWGSWRVISPDTWRSWSSGRLGRPAHEDVRAAAGRRMKMVWLAWARYRPALPADQSRARGSTHVSSGPMEGVKVVEVAQFTYVPSAGATLADWGATVLKIEHAFTGDAQRGMIGYGPAAVAEGTFSPIMEHPNRGKRSVGLDIGHPDGLRVLYRLVEDCDVFLTNFLPEARARLRIDVDDIRAVNPQVIYARGSALGHRGPESLKGGFDSASYWARGGGSMGVTPPDLSAKPLTSAPAHGDTLGGLTIAGGVAAALFSTRPPVSRRSSTSRCSAWAPTRPRCRSTSRC